MNRAAFVSLIVLCAGCKAAAPPSTTTPSAAKVEAPPITVTDPELTKPLKMPADPRKAIADKASVEALVAWMPNDTKALLVCGPKPSPAPVDKLLEPLQGALPRELVSLVAGVRELPSAVRTVASGAESLLIVRADDEGPLTAETAIVYVPKGTKGIGEKKVAGLATKDNEVLNMPTWTAIVLDDAHLALAPRPRVEAFAKAVDGRATGQPAALKGAAPTTAPNVVAQAWVLPSEKAQYATFRLESSPSGDLAMRVTLAAAEGEGDDLAKALREAMRKAEGTLGADYRRAKLEAKGDALALDVAFSAKTLSALTK